MRPPTSLFARLALAAAFVTAACVGVTAPASPAGAQGVGAMSRDNGRVEIVERAPNGAVIIRSLQDGAWGAPTNLGGVTQFAPDVSSWGNDRLDVFAVGTDGALWQKTQTGTTWGAWQSLGGIATSSPAAVSWGANRIDVFIRGADGALWSRSMNGTTWGGWFSLGGYTSGAPTVASWGPNRLDVFVAGGDRRLWHRAFDGAWGSWEGLGGVVTDAPGATAWGPGRLDIFVRGADGGVWGLAWLGNRWFGFYPLGGSIVGPVDVASRAVNTLDVFARGFDGRLYRQSYSSAWSGWSSVPSFYQGVFVDVARIPAPAVGDSTMMMGPSTYSPTFSDGVGAMRVPCSLSHMNFDDPIVFPGQVDATHLHSFWGNTGVNAFSTANSIANAGNSTCDGGTANRSAYWAPSMIDMATGAPVRGDGDHALHVYYKTGYRGVPSNTVRNFPAGLRMIAGDSRRTTAPGPWDPAGTRYECHGSGTGQHFSSIPSCAPGQILIMAVQFPQCWDGVNLDSPNHQSHMAYGTPYGLPNPGCPASHPVPLPEITMNMRYPVPASGSSTWRLSSDTYSGPAGYSGHADWWNGWHAPTFQRVVDNCYRHGLDCQMGLLGDGYTLW